MNNTDYIIDCVTWVDAQVELMRIRSEVFVQEQRVPQVDEWDGKDEDAIHFLVRTDKNEVIATARVLTEQNAMGKKLYHIGRVAVSRDWRARGVGHQLMLAVIEWCLHPNAEAELYLHAQTTRRKFYQRLGFVTQGTEFIDAGIPHITMWYRPKQNR